MVWCTSAIGLAVSFEFYMVSILTTLLALILLIIPHYNPKYRKKEK